MCTRNGVQFVSLKFSKVWYFYHFSMGHVNVFNFLNVPNLAYIVLLLGKCLLHIFLDTQFRNQLLTVNLIFWLINKPSQPSAVRPSACLAVFLWAVPYEPINIFTAARTTRNLFFPLMLRNPSCVFFQLAISVMLVQ